MEVRDEWQRAKFVWGETDCIMATCNYIMDVTGIDPAAPWRGSYSDEAGAQAIYEVHGGVLGLFDYGMAQAGFHRSERGLLRPVVAMVGRHQIAGIDFGKRIGFMADGRGLVEVRVEVLGAWKIC